MVEVTDTVSKFRSITSLTSFSQVRRSISLLILKLVILIQLLERSSQIKVICLYVYIENAPWRQVIVVMTTMNFSVVLLLAIGRYSSQKGISTEAEYCKWLSIRILQSDWA